MAFQVEQFSLPVHQALECASGVEGHVLATASDFVEAAGNLCVSLGLEFQTASIRLR
jgi:hypothetical protein